MLRQRLFQVRSYANLGRHASISVETSNAFQDSLHANTLLSQLRDAYLSQRLKIQDEDPSEALNSLNSLPMTSLPKQGIFTQVSEDAKVGQWRKGIVKWFRLGLYMLKYYKNGVKNTYLLARKTRPLLKHYDSQNPLVTDLYKKVEFNEIEHRLTKKGQDKPIELLPLSRRQLVECYRQKEIWKLPAFFLLAVVFEEFTAVICYLWPKMAPHNCLTPGGFAKISRTHANNHVGKLGNVPSYKSPYTLPEDEVDAKLKSLAVEETPYWKLKLYRIMNNKTIPRETLMRTHQYLFVDDWLLLQHILHQPTSTLTVAELVDCIWLRQLYYQYEDINAIANDPRGQRVLVWRLLIYWAFRFDKTVSCGGDALFAERWGVNNVAILNYSGQQGGSLVNQDKLSVLDGSQ